MTDTEVVHAIHQAALDAVAAKQRNDFDAYSAALQRLYALGVSWDRVQTFADVQALANAADRDILGAGLLGTLKNVAVIAGIGLGLFLVWPFLYSRRKAS